MFSIGYLIICEDVIIEQQQTIIKKPLAAITPLSLPGNFSFKVAFSLFNTSNDDEIDNKIQVIFKDPKNQSVIDTGKLGMKTNPEAGPKSPGVEFIEADISINNAELFEEGIYSLTLSVNDESKVLKIPVFPRPERDG